MKIDAHEIITTIRARNIDGSYSTDYGEAVSLIETFAAIVAGRAAAEVLEAAPKSQRVA